jgi:hypothetical protein
MRVNYIIHTKPQNHKTYIYKGNHVGGGCVNGGGMNRGGSMNGGGGANGGGAN